MDWQSIETAPRDGTEIWVYAPAAHGLQEVQCWCAYHPDAGFCMDEFRDPTHWMPTRGRIGRREEMWTVTVRNRWDERIYFAWRILFNWPKQY